MSENKYTHIKSKIISFDIYMNPKDKSFIERFKSIMEKIHDSDGANSYGMRQVKYSKIDDGFATYYVTKLSCFLTYGYELLDGGFDRFIIKITGINTYNLRGDNSIFNGADGSQMDIAAQSLGSLTEFFRFIGYYGHTSDDVEYLEKRDTWYIENVVCAQDFYVHGHPEFYIQLFRKVAEECTNTKTVNMKGLGWRNQWSNDVVEVNFFHMKKWTKKYNDFLEANRLEPLHKKEMKACENRMRFSVKVNNIKAIVNYAYEYPDLSLIVSILSGEYGIQDLLLYYSDSLFTPGKMIFSSYNQIPESVKEESVIIDGESFDKTFTKLFYSYKTCKGNMGQYILG